jgi:hypothetical protein
MSRPLIGAANDPLEREADRVADAVLADRPVVLSSAAKPDAMRRMCGDCAEEAMEEPIHRKADSGNVAAGGANVAAAALTGGGTSLAPELRAYFEPRFGRDFSAVRVHTGADTGEAARMIGARAYTYGNDIAFAPDAYAPTTGAGIRLLAHELAHVVQQRNGAQVIRRGIGEMWGALWGAGPLDAYRGKRLATEALAAAQQTGLPGLHNGPADAWRHCYWNCRMVEEINAEDAADIASNHEAHGGGAAIENEMDTHNNEVGQSCSGGGCAACCQNHLDSGRLWIIDESRGQIVRSSRVSGATPNPRYYERY